MIENILLLTIFSALITFFFTPVTILLAKKYGLVDNPKVRPHPAHTHSGIIPRAGGLPIFLGIIIPLVLLFPITKQLLGIAFGALILILIGLWDDKKDRSPHIRFLTNSIAALIAVGAGVGIPFITNPFGNIIHLDNLVINLDLFGDHNIYILADIFAFLWIIWTTNIIGWSGGVDGQLPGFVSISAIIIGILSIRFVVPDPTQLQVTYLSFLTAGAFLGFLPWNFFPQKIMPGYGGKTLAGFMLGILSILAYSKVGTAILVLAVPMCDAVFILLKRILKRKSLVEATSGHLHHHLLVLGWGRRRIAVFYWIISAVFGILALVLNSKQKVFAAILILVAIGGFLFLINGIIRLTKTSENEEF